MAGVTLDGLMYGTLGGLGMAIEESLMYLSFAPATVQTLGAEVDMLIRMKDSPETELARREPKTR